MSEHSKKRKVKFPYFLGIAIITIFVLLLGLVVFVYKSKTDNRFVDAIENIFPFPAIYVQGAGIISISEVKQDKAAIKKFYETQDFSRLGMRVDFSTQQGMDRLKIKEKDVANKLVENKIIEALAKQRGISISDANVNDEVNTSIDKYGNRQNLMSELGRLYGWSLDDFKQKVVKPELYAAKLTEAYSAEVDTSAQQKKINDLKDRVTVKKEDFAKVATESSEGESSKNGGDLGWSTKDQLIPEVANVAFSMNVAAISDVIKSPLGFHIVKLEEKKNVDGEDMVHLRQIFVKTETFADWLKQQMKDYSVMVFLPDYQWNKNLAVVEFKDPGMRQFEANLASNSEGDPSVFP
jgi:parvulin-like peptidyl-prolyl isomerase